MDPTRPLQHPNALPHKLRPSLGPSDAPNPPPPPRSSEVHFHHRCAKIVKFELPQSAHIPPPTDISSELDYVVDAIETLPWRLSTERIVALGHMKIEHVPGSTIFLKSGSVVQTLMKNCQCWCVDGSSIFVIRIRRLTYYRIELPYETERDKEQVEALKKVLSTIIRYEVTPCPFKRGFSVELPEESKTPRKKKAWRPKLEHGFESRKLSFGEAGSDSLGCVGCGGCGGCGRSDAGSSRRTGNTEEGDVTDGSERTPKARRCVSIPHHDGRSPPIPIRPQAVRNVTEPTYAFDSLMATFQALPDSECESEREMQMENDNLSSSVDSFHSFQSSRSLPLPPSPPYSNTPSPPNSHPFITAEKLHTPPQRSHNGESSRETTVFESPAPRQTDPEPEPRPKNPPAPPTHPTPTPTPTSSSFPPASPKEIHTPPPPPPSPSPLLPNPRHRTHDSWKRDLSPLPPHSTLSLYQPSPINKLTTTILRKACSLVISTPIQVFAVLLHIAARLAKKDGLRRELSNGYESVVEDDEDEDEDDDRRDVWSEDDFGIPISVSAYVSRRWREEKEEEEEEEEGEGGGWCERWTEELD
ncbi:hypothetical protein PAAG_03354 [Paracoccidioides lutzii Pb01]|uniref:Inheritance of peroxisomes protein 1 n=1 Tax=Paracoccidioides lutzii (strain ATCC MYA-826 / Pb01) TaxID=502779 RepID=C1GWY0_PARBA|nr:hypothetical protein PAAG_03354 [Paracoccidioides lutzii Pb01]EEH41068.2 hypothetical protein PAAG_03354 [Paracoccidioides lutzii Pb01]